MKVLIGIATYQRQQKLKRCIDSILSSSYAEHVKIVVVADNQDYATQTFIRENYGVEDQIDVLVQPKQSFVIGNWNRVVGEYRDHQYLESFVGLCDDVILASDAIENAVNALNLHFPDGDGVVGFKQVCKGHDNYTFKWFGQTLMGRKFIERYKVADYKICCPFFAHFYQDEEMFQFANSLGKFHCCVDAVLDHNHPSFTGDIDSTHYIVREKITPPMGNGPSLRRSTSLLELDTQIFRRRQSEGKLWGKNWDL